MPISELDFLDFSKHSLSLGSEIGARMAIGRSYYSMYHSALELLEHAPTSYKKGGCHETLINYLRDHNDEPYDKKQLRRISVMLSHGKTLRHKADYDLESEHLTDMVAQQQIHQAETIAALCKELKEVA